MKRVLLLLHDQHNVPFYVSNLHQYKFAKARNTQMLLNEESFSSYFTIMRLFQAANPLRNNLQEVGKFAHTVMSS